MGVGKVGDDKRRVSTGGGTQPVWNANGRELLYLSDGQLMSVALKGGPGAIEIDVPKPLFKTRGLSRFNISHEYDLSPDGKRILLGTLVGQPRGTPTIMLNWAAALKN